VATPLDELDELFRELDALLKNPEVGAALADRGVNQSLAIVAKDGLLAYLQGRKAEAAEDFATFAEEVLSRLPGPPSGRPS
jgi:hypothetical protein